MAMPSQRRLGSGPAALPTGPAVLLQHTNREEQHIQTSRLTLRREEIAERLTEARARTLLLVSSLSDQDLGRQHSPLMSPIVWDMGHIAHFEEVWLLEKLEGKDGDSSDGEGVRGIYDPYRNPRSTRKDLELPGRSEALEYLCDVRRAVLDRLDGLDLEGARREDRPLLAEGFVFQMVLQHEYQHNETILQTLQLKKGDPYPAPRCLGAPDPSGGVAPPPGTFLRFPGGPVQIGSDDWAGFYDNERPAHVRELDPFWIGAVPVTEGEFLAFIEDGGYEREELWSPEGREWLDTEGHREPGGWVRKGGEWTVRVMDRERPPDPRRPVVHVCFHEAEAYARWAGARLPTEFEWEAAASWDPVAGEARLFPWGDEAAHVGRANLDQLTFDTAPLGSYPANVSPTGCYGMIGDVWEWTSSEFRPYPGYETFPDENYSEAFFGPDFRVLRGGSWATRPGAVRNTFRNWDYPIRRQIFSGIRIARDD